MGIVRKPDSENLFYFLKFTLPKFASAYENPDQKRQNHQ